MRMLRCATLCVALAASGAQAQDDSAMLREKTAARLAEIVARAHGVVGYATIDLATGQWLGANEDLVFPQASAIKIPVLLEVLRQAGTGRFSLEDRHAVSGAAQVGGSGVAQYFGDGTSALSAGDLAVLMIVLSDNTATNMLIELVGMDSVNATLAAAGFAQTRLRRLMMDTRASAENRENTSTPAEAARMMAMLHQGALAGPAVSGEMRRILSLGKGGSFERAFPDSVTVAYKPGGLAGVGTVWALVDLPERPFALAVMEKFDSRGEAGEIQQEIARTLFDYYWRLGNASRHGTFVGPGPR